MNMTISAELAAASAISSSKHTLETFHTHKTAIMSSAESTHSTQHEDKTPTDKTPQASTGAGEYEDAEKNFQPKTLKFWMIIIGMYLSIFLVALVSLERGSFTAQE